MLQADKMFVDTVIQINIFFFLDHMFEFFLFCELFIIFSLLLSLPLRPSNSTCLYMTKTFIMSMCV